MAEVLKRAVVVERALVVRVGRERWESEQVRLTTLVQSPDVIDHPEKLVITCTGDPKMRSCYRTLVPHVSSTLYMTRYPTSTLYIYPVITV